MRSSSVSAAILAFASAVFAQTAGFDPITQPIQDENVPAGQPFNIVWEPSANYTGTITIGLLEGATPSTLSKGAVVQAGIENSLGTYSWAVPTSLESFATYGFIISLDSDTTVFQYSFPFHITGLSNSGAVNSSSTSTQTVHLSTGTAYTSSATPLSNSTTSSTIAKPSSNITLSTTIVAKTTAPPSQTASSTSSPSASATKNAAVAQVASGSLAMIGGLVLAFAL